ncbi:MAG TPA: sugar phosphate isomerase/epimerase, partial [Thermodesulfobacteriota bacterium]|nr:sugar phosphate isomerase/epimerase [Thermodesulfobacteriota bacterium]
MNYPWTKYIHLGIVAQAFYQGIRDRKGPVAETIGKIAADPFFQAVELAGAEDPGIQKELSGILKASGKTLVFSGGGYCYSGQNNLHDLDEGRRENAIRNVEKIIDEAHGYGCRILYVMGFEAPPSGKEEAKEKFADSLLRLADYARTKNPKAPMTISVENFYILKDTPFLIGPTLDFAAMLRGLRRKAPNLGLTFDTSHILQLKEDLPSTYRQVQDVIAHVHLSNCLIKDRASPFYGDKHPPYGLPGSEIGIAELAGFFKALKDSGHFSRSS